MKGKCIECERWKVCFGGKMLREPRTKTCPDYRLAEHIRAGVTCRSCFYYSLEDGRCYPYRGEIKGWDHMYGDSANPYDYCDHFERVKYDRQVH